jgi:preprotein translocase subunit SecG
MMDTSGCKEAMDRKDDEEVMEREQDRTGQPKVLNKTTWILTTFLSAETARQKRLLF